MAAPSGPPTALDALTVAGVPTLGMGAGIPTTTGNVYFVSSLVGSNGNTGSATSPYATIAFAYSRCIANNGDTVVAMPGHAETISTAAGLNLNIVGITVVGLGEGNTRPVLTFATSTAATLTMTAASNQLLNFILTTSVDQIVSPIVVSAASCTVNCEWRDGSAVVEALRAILTTSAASNLTVNLVYKGFTAGTHGVNAIRLVGGSNATINVDYYGILTTGVVEFVTTAVVNAQISGYFYVSGTAISKDVVDTVGGSTWAVQGFDGVAGAPINGSSSQATASGSIAPLSAQADTSVFTSAAVVSNGLALFTITGGPIEIVELLSIFQTVNGATASTLQYSSSGTLGATTQTISGASASLANATAGTSVIAQLTALATAPLVNANGANISATPGGIVVPAGSITAVVGVGSTTGTVRHYLRYRPLQSGAAAVAAF